MCLRTLKFETMLLQNWDITSNFYIAILQSYDSSPTIYCCMLRLVLCSAPSVPQPVFTITEKALTRAFSWLKAPTSAFTFKTLC